MAGLTPTPKRPTIDWEGIEMHYRAGIRSLMDMAKEYNVSDAGILKRAKAKGWSRDLAGKIKARATAKLNEALVSGAVSAQRKSKEGAIVEAVSDQQVQAETDNRNDILLGMRVTRGQLNEVAAMAEGACWVSVGCVKTTTLICFHIFQNCGGVAIDQTHVNLVSISPKWGISTICVPN